MQSDEETVAQREYESPPPQSDAEDLEEITARNEIAYRVYYDLWKDFYDWEYTYCLHTLSQTPSSFMNIRPPPLPQPEDYHYTQWKPPLDVHEEWLTVEDIDPHTRGRTQVTISCDPLHVTKWAPHPRYTICTPSGRNMKWQGDLHRRCRYAFFADNRAFNLRAYLKEADDFAWQNDYLDPDLEMIEMEVTRRLLYKHNFSMEDVDHLNILTYGLRESNKAGVIWFSQQRDFPWWAGAQSNELPSLQSDWVNSSLSLYESFTNDNPAFCANLNCIFVNCGLHGPNYSVTPPRPTVTADMIRQEGQPCRNDCYKSIDKDNINMTNTHWDDADTALFKSIITHTPDSTPCDLAVICRKPCVEMYVERFNFFRDEDIVVDNDEQVNQRLRTSKVIEFAEDNVQDNERVTVIVGPCVHPGPCNQYADCVCYRNKQRCQRTCRCSLKCEIRYKGCKCRPSKRYGSTRNQCCGAEQTHKCQCRKLSRECDPELCKGCSAKSTHKSTCQNTNLQKGLSVPIRIKESQYGLGAFATTPIKAGAYIGEYVGELIMPELDNHLSLDLLLEHVGLNYTFGLVEGGTTLLDSWNAGNETRYLNHAVYPNCKADTLMVHDTYRIVLRAEHDIKSGTELTLDYGNDYWKTNHEARPSNEYPEDSFDPVNMQWEAYT